MNKRLRVKVILAVVFGTLISTGALYAMNPLDVTVPLFGTVGQSQAVACDTDGVTTSYTYGANNHTGIKVTSVTVAGINPLCTSVTVSFLNVDTEVAAYSTTNTTGSVTMATNIWTDNFTDVRVILLP